MKFNNYFFVACIVFAGLSSFFLIENIHAATWGNITTGSQAEVILNFPADKSIVTNATILYNASANVTNGAYITNLSLWDNSTGTWHRNQTIFIGTEYQDNLPPFQKQGPSPDVADYRGLKIVVGTANITLTKARIMAQTTATKWYLYNSTGTTGGNIPLVSGTIASLQTSDINYKLLAGATYYLLAGSDGAGYDNSWETSNVSYPFIETGYNITKCYSSGSDCTNVVSTFQNITIYQSLINSTTQIFASTIPQGNTTYNVQACDTDSVCGFAPNNYTIFYNSILQSFMDFPQDNSNLTSNTTNFSIIGIDSQNVTKLELWGNFTGVWALDSTNSSPVNNTRWNVTKTFADGRYIASGCSYNNNNSQTNCTSNITFTIDATGPAITLPIYANLSQKINTSTLSLNVYLNDAISGLTGSICYVNINGTNQSVVASNNWCNISNGWLTNLVDGEHQIKVYANDTLGTLGVNDSYYIETISSKPAITIISPVGLKSSTSITFNFSIQSSGTLVNCTYNVTSSTGVIIVANKYINCSNALDYQIIGDSGGVPYTTNVFANDTLGNNNTFSATFEVDLTPGSVLGGGGSPEEDEELENESEKMIGTFCLPYKSAFSQAWKDSLLEKNPIKKIQMIYSKFMDYIICGGAASIIPL